MKLHTSIGLGVLLLCTACGSDDGAGGTGGAAGMGSGGISASGGTGGVAGVGSGGSSGMTGSGGSSGGGGATAAGGQVIAPWDTLCVATFTQDFDVIDSFGDLIFTARTGDRYLLGEEHPFAAATLLYIAPDGVAEVEMEADETMLPFTSSCTGATQSVVGVFADMPVFADEALTMELCTLPAGLKVPGAAIEIAVAGDLFSSKYSIQLHELAAHCNGATSGFANAAEIEVGSTIYIALPIASVMGPAD